MCRSQSGISRVPSNSLVTYWQGSAEACQAWFSPGLRVRRVSWSPKSSFAFADTDYRTEICSDDREERALVSATINEMAYVFQAWLPILVWAQVDAPKYHTGFITATCLSVVLIIATMVTRHLHEREKALYVAKPELSGAMHTDKIHSKQVAGEVFERTDTNSSEEAQIEVNVPKKD